MSIHRIQNAHPTNLLQRIVPPKRKPNAEELRQQDLRPKEPKEPIHKIDTFDTVTLRSKLGYTSAHETFNYSKEDALQVAWNQHNDLEIALYSPKVTQGEGYVDLPSLTPPENFVETVQKKGILRNVDWTKKSRQFQRLRFQDIQEGLDVLASQYAVLGEHIQKNRQERQEHLNMEAVIDQHKDRLIQETAQNLGKAFDPQNRSQVQTKTKAQLQRAFQERVQTYETHIKTNKNYAKVEGTKDTWLTQDTDFMASALRRSVQAEEQSKASIVPQNTQKTPVEALQMMSDLVQEVSHYGFGAKHPNGTKPTCEERLGLQLGELALKGAMVEAHAPLSEDWKGRLQKSIDQEIATSIQALDDYLKLRAEKSSQPRDKKGFAPVNPEAVYAVVDSIRQTYAETDSPTAALRAGARTAVEQYQAKRDDQGEIFRYQGDAFSHFYENDSRTIQTDSRTEAPYVAQEPELIQRTARFNQFVDVFSLGIQQHAQQFLYNAWA